MHRFYQMWQQLDCNVTYASSDNPSGCLADLFPWVETSIGAGSNGKPHPGPTFLNTGEGSTAMAFYNVQQGDAPYMKQLADQYTLSDNFHQSVMGGTGANHIMFGYRRCHLVQRRSGQRCDAAHEPDREPRSLSGHQ